MTREPGWEQRLLTVFDDLEQQAAAAFGAEREAEVAERARSEYAARHAGHPADGRPRHPGDARGRGRRCRLG